MRSVAPVAHEKIVPSMVPKWTPVVSIAAQIIREVLKDSRKMLINLWKSR